MTGVLRIIHSAIFWFLVFFYSVVINKCSYLRALFIKSTYKKKLVYQKGVKIWGNLILKSPFIRVKVTGLENIPKDTNVIFTPNHQSYLDIFILLKYLPTPFKFVVMRKLFKMATVGDHITKCGFPSLDKKDRKTNIKTIHLIIDLLKRNRSFVIFPEGQLTTDGTIGEFGRGTAMIVQNSKKPVIPVSIDGAFEILPKGAWKLRPGEVRLNIGKPIIFDEYYDNTNKQSSLELAAKIREAVVNLKEKQ